MYQYQPTNIPPLGTAPPDFTAPSTSGENVTLSELRGSPVLVAFFPLAFTDTCTAELCDISNEYDLFAQRGVTVLPISVDSRDTLLEYRAKYNMRTHLLSDFHRRICTAWGVLNEERFYSQRSYFLIDSGGVLRWSHVESINGRKRSNLELLAAIDKLT